MAGTNGKGSTAAMIDVAAARPGLRIGRVHQPRTCTTITERIAIDGEPIAVERFDDTRPRSSPTSTIVDAQLIDGVAMTFFEVMTAMAYAAFADAPVDVAVVEVGMGGDLGRHQRRRPRGSP